MQVHYLEIVTQEVDATCVTHEQLHGVTFSEGDPGLGNARTAVLSNGGMIGVRAPMHESEEPVVRPYLLAYAFPDFQGTSRPRGTQQMLLCYTRLCTLSRDKPIPRMRASVKKKRELFPGVLPPSPGALALPP